MYIKFHIREYELDDNIEVVGMRTKFKLHKLYYVKFKDHAFGINKVCVINAVGWVTEDDPDYVVLTPWLVESDDYDVVKNNQEPFTIIKSCIIKKRVIDV